MNLLKSIFLFAVVASTLIFNECLKSNCTDQVKNPELFGLWYFYKVRTIYWHCDSTDSKGDRTSYHCDKLRIERVLFQFSADKFIEKTHSDTTVDTAANAMIDHDIIEFNEYWFYTCGYNFYSIGERDWFVDNNKLLICEDNSMCFEGECNVYTWKIDHEKLFLQNDRTTYVLTREDLFEKIRNSVKIDSSK